LGQWRTRDAVGFDHILYETFAQRHAVRRLSPRQEIGLSRTGIMGLLEQHMKAIEVQLLATSQIPSNSGHSLHKGTPRESFIGKFLEEHLSESLALGTGEIIDANSAPNQSRNQIDIVVYRRDYPR
jgi:hypothetical protein